LITVEKPAKSMREEAHQPLRIQTLAGKDYPEIQIWTIEGLLHGKGALKRRR
jgi:hypothetical protein